MERKGTQNGKIKGQRHLERIHLSAEKCIVFSRDRKSTDPFEERALPLQRRGYFRQLLKEIARFLPDSLLSFFLLSQGLSITRETLGINSFSSLGHPWGSQRQALVPSSQVSYQEVLDQCVLCL